MDQVKTHQIGYSNLLANAQNFLAPSNQIDRLNWEKFSAAQGITTSSLDDTDSLYYPIRAFAYIPRVEKTDLTKFTGEVRDDKSLSPDGLPNYSVFPSGDREYYYPIEYSEPMTTTAEQALGFDVGTSSSSQPALAEAMDTGQVAVTQSFNLKFLNEEGIVAYAPVYSYYLPHDTVEERETNLIGYVAEIFETKQILAHMLTIQGIVPLVDADVFQGGAISEENIIYDADAAMANFSSDYKPRFTDVASDFLANHWIIRFHSTPALDAEMDQRIAPQIVLFGGFAIDILLVFLIYYLSQGKRRAMKLAENMTEDLKNKNQNLQKVNRALKTISNANQITVSADEESQLLKEACKILVDVGGYRLVWIGYQESADRPILKPVAWAGYDEGYIERAVAVAEKEHVPDPILQSVTEKRILIIPDLEKDENFRPWLKDATQRGYKSTVALPLLSGETVLGTMAIYSSELGAFTPEEVNLLEELSRSLSYGVVSIRDRKEKRVALFTAERAAEELKEKNRALLVISEANQVTIKAQNEDDLIKDVCDVLVKNAGYRLVWVGYAENNENKSVRPVAWAGPENGYIQKLNVSWADVERGRGPAGTAIREKRTVTIPDFTKELNFKPWLKDALERGYVGGVFIPLFSGKDVFGVISIYTAEVNLFSSDQARTLEEIKMLQELAGDLSFSILNIRNKETKEKIDATLRKTTAELQQFRLAVDNASDHIIITDAKGTIVYANKGAEHITGYSRSEMIGKNPRLWGGQMTKEFYQKMWQMLSVEKKPFVGELQNKRKNGESYDARSSITPILDDEGTIIYYVGVERDITKETAIDRSKSEFVSLASHQLRTPLSAINWYSEMLLGGDAGKLSVKQKDYTQEIYASSKRMSDLVGALLNVSRIELGTFAIQPKPTNVSEISDSVIQELQQKINSKNQVIEKKYSKTPLINVDPNLTRIIIQNLISNSVKYTPDGGKIIVIIKKVDENLQIEVTDSGYGIPLYQQDKVFTRFFRADNIIPIETDGTGLGLYIVKEVLEKAGGSIRFESEENKGTTFYVNLPFSGMPEKEGLRSLN